MGRGTPTISDNQDEITNMNGPEIACLSSCTATGLHLHRMQCAATEPQLLQPLPRRVSSSNWRAVGSGSAGPAGRNSWIGFRLACAYTRSSSLFLLPSCRTWTFGLAAYCHWLSAGHRHHEMSGGALSLLSLLLLLSPMACPPCPALQTALASRLGCWHAAHE